MDTTIYGRPALVEIVQALGGIDQACIMRPITAANWTPMGFGSEDGAQAFWRIDRSYRGFGRRWLVYGHADTLAALSDRLMAGAHLLGLAPTPEERP